MKKISTSAKNLEWYHLVIITSQALFFLLSFSSLLYIFLQIDNIFQILQNYHGIFLPVATTIFSFILLKRSAYYMIKSQTVMTYANSEIISLQTSKKTLSSSVNFNEIKHVIRKTPTCIEIVFNQAIPCFDLEEDILGNSSTKTEKIVIHGNEIEIDEFCEEMNDLKLLSSIDYNLTQDPRKNTAVIILVFASLACVFILILALAPKK